MLVRNATVILICLLIGVVLGLGVGHLMGTLAPSFGLNLLVGRDFGEPMRPINAYEISLGLGIANGAGLGVISGIALILAEAIRSRREVPAEIS